MDKEYKGSGGVGGPSPSSSSSGTQPLPVHHANPKIRESTIFGLPKEIRNDIYRGVLYVPHPLYLFQDNGSQIEVFAPERPQRWLALLQVNRQIHLEAAKILFGANHFALLDDLKPQNHLLEAFINCVGAVNSASLSHISMDFPRLAGSAEDSTIDDNSLRRFKLLQEYCTNLTTVETSFSVKHVRELDRLAEQDEQLAETILSQINLQLQAVPSLQKIVVRITGPKPALPIINYMQTLGWAILPAYGNH